MRRQYHLPSTQRNPKEPPEPYPESWMHTIENVRTGVPWLMMSIHGSAAEKRAEIAFERGALRAPYVPRNREGFPTTDSNGREIAPKTRREGLLARGVWVLSLCGALVHYPGERRFFQMNKVRYSNGRGTASDCVI